ncbi:hypothetical protein ACFL6O_04300 [candidate division KSB1 bacterium]
MPIHLEDTNIASEIDGIKSALIVPCNLCPAVTVAVDKKKPFLRIFRDFLKCDPFEQYILGLQSRLGDMGVKADVFRSDIPHQWFMCMWTTSRRKKLQKHAEHYDAVIALGCDSANETVRDAVKTTGCKVIEGMEVTGIMNAKLKVSLSGNVSFEGCQVTRISQRKNEEVFQI